MDTIISIGMFAAIVLTVIYYRFWKMEKDAYYDDIDEDDGDDRDAFEMEEDQFLYVDPSGNLCMDFLPPI